MQRQNSSGLPLGSQALRWIVCRFFKDVAREHAVAGVWSVPEVPSQHLPLSALDEVLRCFRDGKEGELLIVVRVRGCHRRRVTVAGEYVLGQDELRDSIGMLQG